MNTPTTDSLNTKLPLHPLKPVKCIACPVIPLYTLPARPRRLPAVVFHKIPVTPVNNPVAPETNVFLPRLLPYTLNRAGNVITPEPLHHYIPPQTMISQIIISTINVVNSILFMSNSFMLIESIVPEQ
jgi:hypothetical protein